MALTRQPPQKIQLDLPVKIIHFRFRLWWSIPPLPFLEFGFQIQHVKKLSTKNKKLYYTVTKTLHYFRNMYWLSKTNTKLPTICKNSTHTHKHTEKITQFVQTEEICHITYVLTYLDPEEKLCITIVFSIYYYDKYLFFRKLTVQKKIAVFSLEKMVPSITINLQCSVTNFYISKSLAKK